MSGSIDSFYSQPIFDTEDISVSSIVLSNSDDDDATSFDPFDENIPIFAILGAMFEEDEPHFGGSIAGRKYVNRDREAAHFRLFTDYFARYPCFDEDFFRRRFRMRRSLFNKILNDIMVANPFFEQKRDATFRLGISPLVKMTTAIRMLSYACVADTLDEWLKIRENTVLECLVEFCSTVITLYSAEFTRQPNEGDITRLLAKGEERGFPGMFGSLDRMHWVWKNCLVAWKEEHTGHTQQSTLILECVADYECWIWHAFFGMVGSHNDLSVLENSHIFDNLVNETTLPCNYVVNNVHYNMGYYLADGIYPESATLIQTLKTKPTNEMERYFVKCQESCRKDVERTFRILQGRFVIVKQPPRFLDRGALEKIIKTCIIIHNMIIQDERGLNLPIWKPPSTEKVQQPEILPNENFINDIIERTSAISSRVTNQTLKYDLIVHQWFNFGRH